MFARPAAVLAVLVLVVSAAACSSGGGDAFSGKMTVSGAWARPSTGMGMAGAAYLSIDNGTNQPDVLLKVSTPAATTAELHETTVDASGMMAMHPVDGIAVPAGGTVTLAPGGFHIMLIGLTGELKVGATIELTLTFAKAGEVKVTAEVRAS